MFVNSLSVHGKKLYAYMSACFVVAKGNDSLPDYNYWRVLDVARRCVDKEGTVRRDVDLAHSLPWRSTKHVEQVHEMVTEQRLLASSGG